MATLDDLFGNKSSGPKGPRSANGMFQNPGDAVVGVITAEPDVVPETDFDTRKPKFMVKTDEGWKPRKEGEFDTSLDHFALTQIRVVVALADGEEVTHYIGGQKRDALKLAMQDSGLPLDIGTTLAIKFVGKKGNAKQFAVKLAKSE